MRYFLIILLFCSCGNRKQMIRAYVDEVISEKIKLDNINLTNKKIDDNLTISYRVNEYDTSGRVIKETIAQVEKVTKEEVKDSIVQKVETEKDIDRLVDIEVEEKRSNSLIYFVVGFLCSLLLLLLGYFYLKKM